MRVEDILNMIKDYLKLGIVIVGIVVLLMLIGYEFIYKKVCKGKRRIDYPKFIWWFVFLFYLFVVLSVTLFRSNIYRNGSIISFFYSYKEAWIQASEAAWRNIILNILMFVPLGFWLPVGKERFRGFWKISLVGCGLTAAIEVLQLILSLGLFEVADVLNNTLGAMIGYGFYEFFEFFVRLCKKEKPKLLRVIACQVPLVLTVCMFACIFAAYRKQELGNLSIECISPYAKDSLVIMSNEEYRNDKTTATVYQTNVLTVEETEEFAKTFFENLGTKLDERRNDVYENTAVYWAEEAYNLWIDYNGGTYDMRDFDTSFPKEGEEKPQVVENAAEEEILQALLVYGIVIPTGAAFSYHPDKTYTFEVKRIESDGGIRDGILTCEYCDNGKFASIRNGIKEFEIYKQFEIISEQEAYEQILNGEFTGAINKGDEIQIGRVTLDYLLDTKGFYQPIYRFEVKVNGNTQSICIPAIKKGFQ